MFYYYMRYVEVWWDPAVTLGYVTTIIITPRQTIILSLQQRFRSVVWNTTKNIRQALITSMSSSIQFYLRFIFGFMTLTQSFNIIIYFYQKQWQIILRSFWGSLRLSQITLSPYWSYLEVSQRSFWGHSKIYWGHPEITIRSPLGYKVFMR